MSEPAEQPAPRSHADAPVSVPILLGLSGFLITAHPPPFGPIGLALIHRRSAALCAKPVDGLGMRPACTPGLGEPPRILSSDSRTATRSRVCANALVTTGRVGRALAAASYARQQPAVAGRGLLLRAKWSTGHGAEIRRSSLDRVPKRTSTNGDGCAGVSGTSEWSTPRQLAVLRDAWAGRARCHADEKTRQTSRENRDDRYRVRLKKNVQHARRCGDWVWELG